MSTTTSIPIPLTTGSQSGLGTEVCVWGPAPNVTTKYTYTWSGTDGSKTSTPGEMSSPGYFNAFGIEIRWQLTDFNSVPATASATATQDISPSQDSAGSDSSAGLSSGAKVGIGVGVAAGVIAVAIIALFFWFRQRKARQASSVPSHDVYPPTCMALMRMRMICAVAANKWPNCLLQGISHLPIKRRNYRLG